MASYQYVYTMRNLTKNFPGGREVLKDVTLAFLPGAKIGVLGVNGAGKSTLMKIMAGEDPEFNGDAWAAEAVKVGILKQEPDLNPDKDVYGNVLEGMGETHALLQEFEEISAKFAEPMDEDEMTALIEKQGELQEKIDAADGWDLERKLEIAMDACVARPRMQMSASCRAGNAAGSRCVGYCCIGRPAGSTNRPTIWTPSPSRG